MQNTLLTAIIFTYNHKDSIARCIESIVEQKTDYAYEIHIWDDCSIDGTSDICREYAAKYPEKIKLTVQEENTFLKPYMELQSYAAISQIKTPYFCIIDGDDYWCNENKIQIALDFLENNPDYIGFAHDTLQEDGSCGATRGLNPDDVVQEKVSYVHDCLKADIKNPVEFSVDAPFFLTSSRIFRWMDYTKLNVLPIDYLFYYYHLSKGKIYYHDEMMAVYVMGEQSTFANSSNNIPDLNGMFAYRLSLLFDFKQDEFCTKYQKEIDERNFLSSRRHNRLLFLKKIFGVKLGWKLWFVLSFVWKYGLDCMNINYVYSRKHARERVDFMSCGTLSQTTFKETSKLHVKIALTHTNIAFLSFLLATPTLLRVLFFLFSYFRKIIRKPFYQTETKEDYIKHKIDVHKVQLAIYEKNIFLEKL